MMQSICRHCQLSQYDELGTSPEPAGQTFKMASMAVGFQSERKLENKNKWDWNCAGALCTSNWRTQTPRLTYYSLRGIESNENVKKVYAKVLKNGNIDGKKAVICSKHWSSGKQENLEDLVSLPEYVQRLENSKSSVTKRDKKLVAAKRMLYQGRPGPKAKRQLLVRTQKEQDLPDARSSIQIPLEK